MITSISASEAKSKFLELLRKVKQGHSFSITFHGEEAARLVPTRTPDMSEIQQVVSQMEQLQAQCILNPPGQRKLSVRELRDEGRR
jgi:prevent-host-death family protein